MTRLAALAGGAIRVPILVGPTSIFESLQTSLVNVSRNDDLAPQPSSKNASL